MSNFEYLLSPINTIKGVGKKTLSSFNKKKFLQFLTYYGIYLFQELKLLRILRLMIYKLEKITILK